MLDLIAILSMALMVALALIYVTACDELKGSIQ